MFSKKFTLNMLDVKSSAITALQATIAYFGLTISTFYDKLTSGDYTYLLSVVGFFGLTFGIKLVQKWFRDGGKVNQFLAGEVLDQTITPQSTDTTQQ